MFNLGHQNLRLSNSSLMGAVAAEPEGNFSLFEYFDNLVCIVLYRLVAISADTPTSLAICKQVKHFVNNLPSLFYSLSFFTNKVNMYAVYARF